ncbi:tRNA1(Val) (adenine(37)-N6)-methyltransferase [uncultured Desulfuromonas sp.]|uniref:tRNA1(Val) (adenine(37)-N6)-methyltransferase n=1 Tax=uncultured Desulfuromonas sp. TaxID=181013 RepID=UPI002AAA67E3|nr:tRNA1(Val) (adenine(37)-N6)-methyltransferase [uncultured Desulfuromonas sp.]
MTHLALADNETLDRLDGLGVDIIQHRDGYRFSIDPVLLTDFCRPRQRERVVDLGCGSAVMALILARAFPSLSVVGLELQSAQVARARKSVVLNGLEDRINVQQSDVREVPTAWHGDFDLVVCNPPFRPLGQGRCSQGDERALSRHEVSGGLDAFVRASAVLLKHGGRLAMVHLAERSAELMAALSCHGLAVKRLRYVHSRQGSPARLVLIEGRKGGQPGVTIDAPLYLYRDRESKSPATGQRDRYSEEVEQIYAGRMRSG